MGFLRNFKRSVSGLANSLTASAEDPREIWAEPGERELAGLRRIKVARADMAAEIERLEAVVSTARSDLELLGTQDGGDGDGYGDVLRQRTEADVDALDDQLDRLQEQLKALDAAEARLRARAAVLIASQRPAGENRRPAETESTVDAETEALTSLNRAVEEARMSANRLQAKTDDVFKQLTDRTAGGSSEDARRVMEAQEIEVRFFRQSQRTGDETARKILLGGSQLARSLANELRFMQSVAKGRAGQIGHRSGYVVGLAAQTHDLGLRSLRMALEVLQEAGLTRREARIRPDAREGVLAAVDEHMRQASACADAIADARAQLNVLVAGETEIDVRSATESLRRAVDQAGEVQQRLNDMKL